MKIKPLTCMSTDEVYVKKEAERRLERRKQEQENTNKQQSVDPVGVFWPRYLTFFEVSLANCLAGSQVVQLYYRPNLVRILRSVYFMIHEHRK